MKNSRTSQLGQRRCDDEIDLRELALILWRGKRIVVAITLLFALMVLTVSLIMPKQYQTTTNLALVIPKLQVKGIGRLGVRLTKPDLKTAMSLSRSPEIFRRLAEDAEVRAAWPQEAQPLTWNALAGHAKIQGIGDNGLRLSFTDTDPYRSALVANHWAALVAQRINTEYGMANLQAQLTPQVQKAWKAYQQAQDNYEHLLSTNRSDSLKAQLNNVQRDLACLLSIQSQLKRVQQDMASFADYLNRLNPQNPLSPGDALALSAIQQRTLSAQKCSSGANANIQIQWSAETLSSLSVGRARTLVANISAILPTRLQALSKQQQELENKENKLNEELERETARLKVAKQRRDTAWQVYQTREELRAQSDILNTPNSQVAIILTRATPPNKPVSPHTALNVIIGALLGLTFGIIVVVLKYWWDMKPTEEVPNEKRQ